MGFKVERVLLLCAFSIVLSTARIAQLNIGSPSEAFAAHVSSVSSVQRPVAGHFGESAKITLPRYFGAIQKHAARYGLDWRLVLAVMKQESNFDRRAVSRRGAYGLMQVMPATGNEVATKLGLENLQHPHRNIKGGVFYLSGLFRLFEGAGEKDRIRLTLASYNAGPSRIYDAQDLAAYLGENPHSWPSVEKALPLLSKRYYTLHQSVWGGGKPRSGYFGKSRQTIHYVEKVVENFEEYKAKFD